MKLKIADTFDFSSLRRLRTVFMPFFDHQHHDVVVSGVKSHQHDDTSFAGLGGSDLLSIPIKNNNNLQYYSEIEIGQNRGVSPSQKFNVIVDTGSDRLWVPSKDCASSVCKAHHRFDESRSDSFLPTSEHVNLSYGTGSVKARLGRDHVRFGSNMTVSTSYPVALSVSQTDKPFSSLSKIDGIFGIGKQTEFAKAQPAFSVYLSNDTSKLGSLTIGGIDGKHIDETSETHSHHVTDPHSWTIDLVDIKVGDQRLGVCPGGPCKALIDTGSSLITGPPRDVAKLFRAGVHKTCDGYGHDPSPNVSLIFKDDSGREVEYPLSSKEYSIDFQDDHKECKVGFGPLDMGPRKWVVGDSFLRRYVAKFDKAAGKISFVRSQHDDEGIGVLTRQLGNVSGLPLVEKLIRSARAREIGNEFLFN
jgi:hypothetical protein